MKKLLALFLSVVLLLNLVGFFTLANGEDLKTNNEPNNYNAENAGEEETRASGLIFHYSLGVSREGNTTLHISAETICDLVVVKSGFKSLKIERRQNSNSSWATYYSYGNVYQNSCTAYFEDELTVDPGYQYRATCKHYAQKNILNTQTISNTSNIVTF